MLFESKVSWWLKTVVVFAVLLGGVAGWADERVIGHFAESTAAPHGGGNIYAPDIVKRGGVYSMFFGAQGRDGHDRIHLATSRDGETWTQHGVILAPEGVNHVNDPSVVVVRGKWYLFYTRADRDITDTIALATSRDRKTWRDEGTVFGPSPEPAWDSLLIGRPSVIYEKGIFRMWYDGRKDLPMGAPDALAPKSANSHRFVGYAISRDGKTWTRREEPVFGHDAGGLAVTRLGSGYVLCFESHEGTRWATSRDGLTWTLRGMLHEKNAEAGSPFGHVTPFLWIENGEAVLYYGAAAAQAWNRNAIYRTVVELPRWKN